MAESTPMTQLFSERANPSRQYLLGKLFGYRKRLELLEAYPNKEDSGRETRIAACRDYLAAIEEVTITKGVRGQFKSFTAWHLFHRLDETFYPLMAPAELKAQAVEFLQSLKRSSMSLSSVNEWTTKLEDGIKRLSESNAGESERAELAHMLSSAAYAYNDYVDNLFWDLWCKKLVSLIHTVTLLAAIMILLGFIWINQGISVCFLTVLLIGAMGGLGSGILTSQPVTIAYGHFWSVVSYHALVRPLQGAIAAMMTFWLLQSQYLIAIDPPLKPGTKIVECVSGVPCEVPVQVEIPASGKVRVMFTSGEDELTFKPLFNSTVEGDEAKPAAASQNDNKSNTELITLKAVKGMEIYLYLLVLLIAGFSGDKVLKSVTDKVSNKLFADAEKTKEGK